MFEINGSIKLNGKKFTLHPGYNDLGNGLEANLEYSRVFPSGEFLLLRLKNNSQHNSVQITEAKTLDQTFESRGTVHYHTLQGDDCGETSFLPVDLDITESYTEEPLLGRSSSTTGFPYFDLSWDCGAVAIGIGWTGQWKKELNPTEKGINVSVGVADCDFYLLPGEEVRFPSVLIVRGEKSAETLRDFRKTVKNHFSPKTRLGDSFKLPIAIQCFDRYFNMIDGISQNVLWATEEGQKFTVDAAKKLKYIDTLWLDAAWFYKGFPDGVGNFRFSPGFPNGLKPVSDYAHENGMKFVVWFEPERVHKGSDLYPQTEKLLLLDRENENRLYNLSDPAARRWLTDTLISMIRDNGIDIYRQDFNIDPLPYWRANDSEGRKGITELKYVEGLYTMWDDILDAFPDLWIDNCASGGRRLDLEMSRRSVTLWRSDTGCFPERDDRPITLWNHNQILGLAQYLPYHNCAIWDTDAYTVRSTSTQGLAANFHIFDPDFDFAEGERVLAEADEMRKYWDGDFYPLTKATLRKDVWTAYQLALDGFGAVYAFRREESKDETQTYALSCIDESRDYEVTLIDENFAETTLSVSGKELSAGFVFPIPKAKNSLIMRYKAI
ncbi:MAG: alpha-galactosidase [Clostridia bacterium]|nr:alpha-galactosidase [Clostridia bacterium]